MTRKISFASAVAGAAMTALAVTPVAAETVKMTFSAPVPPVNAAVRLAKNFFIPTVNKRLAAGGDFRIEWTEAWSGGLANFRDTFEAVEDNLAQIALVINSFEESNLPLEQISFKVPFSTTNVMLLNKVNKQLHEQFPEMKAAWTKRNQVWLGAGASDSLHLITNFPVTKYEDLKGHRIGATGAASAWLKPTGAVPVTSSMNQALNNIKSGLYDGYPISIMLTMVYKVHEAAKYMTRVGFGSTVGVSLTMNKETFDGMPPYARKIFRETGGQMMTKYSGVTIALEKKFSGIMAKQGLRITEFPAEERKRWAHKLPNLPKQWAETWDKRGLPASKVLAAYLDALRAGGETFVRDWDKE